jgi:hypothetical protein
MFRETDTLLTVTKPVSPSIVKLPTVVDEITVAPEAPTTVSWPVPPLLLIADEKTRLSIFDGAAPV